MAALVSSLHQGERTKMPPITSIISSESESPKSPKKSVNGDTKGFFPPRQSSKKKLKWSIDKLKSDNSSENEKNKSNDVKSKLTSKSASSFFSPKPVITAEHEDEEQKSPVDSALLTDSVDNRNSSDLEKHEKDDSRWTDDDSLLMTPQDKSLARQSTGSINFIDKVVQEILSTEKTYVNNLKEIIEGYLQCMRMKNCPISKENVQHLFINVEKIYEFNREFLKQIENADEDPVEIADCFVKNETGFQTYTEYCTNYPKSVEVLTECTRQREAASFIQEIQMNLGHSLPLGSYLLKPVQRILKYHLLLQILR
ncbi:pleckstrin homology domain-containing family G member 1-like [Exaiptasia diaphana]|uniref:DH domain-containing protein n=1 Tax=Exaiptasia diaphana TaxID=2652724 RepID=A0A913YSH5_EXADI|nr:pleckstrin homology domain-containing family G member 1-like [Exaiptasia diaphana]